MLKRRGRVLLGLVVCVWLGVILLGHLGDRLLLWPTTAPIAAGAAQRRALPFAGGELEVWVMAARSGLAGRYVLRFYGNADRAERWAASEAQDFPDDAETWAVNYPGYGGSTGPASLERVAAAALAAYDAVAASGKPVYVVGTSLGTTAALHVSASRQIAGVVLHNPPALSQLIVGEHGWWNLWLLAWPVAWQLPRQLDSVENARHSKAPALFVLSERDEVVPHKYHQLVAQAYAGEKQLILRPQARHNDPLDDATTAAYHQGLTRIFAR